MRAIESYASHASITMVSSINPRLCHACDPIACLVEVHSRTGVTISQVGITEGVPRERGGHQQHLTMNCITVLVTSHITEGVPRERGGHQ
jgi:hypothetical protein